MSSWEEFKKKKNNQENVSAWERFKEKKQNEENERMQRIQREQRIDSFSNYNNAKKSIMKEIGTELNKQNNISRPQENNRSLNLNKAVVNDETQKRASANINNLAMIKNAQEARKNNNILELPGNISLGKASVNNNIMESKRISKNGQVEVLPTARDMYKMNKQNAQDIVSPVANLGLGAVQGLQNIKTYEDAISKKGASALSSYILSKITGNKDVSNAISNVIVNRIEDQLPSARNFKAEKEMVSKDIASNIGATNNPISKKLSELAPSIGSNLVSGTVSALNPLAGTAMFMTSAGGSYLEEAKQRGMNDDQALGYATVMGIVEGGSEAIITGSMASKILNKTLGKGLSKAYLESFTNNIIENFVQEALTEPTNEFVAEKFGGKADWDNMLQRSLKAGIDGVLSAILMQGAFSGVSSAQRVVEKLNNGEQVTENEINNAVNDTRNTNPEKYNQTLQGAMTATIENNQVKTSEKLPVANEQNRYNLKEQKINNNLENNINALYNNNERESDIYDASRSYRQNENTEISREITQELPTSRQRNERILESNKEYNEYKSNAEQSIKQKIKNDIGFDDNTINEIYDKIQNKNNVTIDDIYDAFDNHRTIEMGSNQDIVNDVKKIQKFFKETKINITNLKNNITDYNDFRKSTFGKLRLVNDINAQEIDQVYKEALELFPGYFDENISNPEDQLQTIAEWLKYDSKELVKPSTYELSNEDLEDVAKYIFNAIDEINYLKNEILKNSNQSSFNMQEKVETSNVASTANDTLPVANKKYNINDKVQEYLSKTGLSSKMSVDEFINKAEKFTLENETNMSKEQQELYNLINDIQIAKNSQNNIDIANEQETLYNNNESESDLNERVYSRANEGNGRIENEITDSTRQANDTRISQKNISEKFKQDRQRSYEEFINYANQNRIKEDTPETQNLKKLANELGLKAIIFKGDEKNDYLGMTDKQNPNNVYIDINQKEVHGEDIIYHEFLHSRKRNNDSIYIEKIQPIEQGIVDNFKDIINNFIDSKGLDERYKNYPELIAEEIIADYSAKHLGNLEIDYNLPKIHEDAINQALDEMIMNMKNSNKNSFNISSELKEEYQQMTIEGFNNEPENNLLKKNWHKYAQSKVQTNEELRKNGTEIKIEKRKFSKDFIDNKYIDLNEKIVNNASDIADIAQIFRNPKYETFRVIYMQGNKIVGQEAVTSRVPNTTRIYKEDSQAKGLYKIKDRMNRLNADGYYLIHNHPTGNAKASDLDIKVTELLDKRINGFLGHVIINSGTYALIEKSKIPNFKDTIVWKDNIELTNYSEDTIDKMMSKDMWANMQIKGQEDILNLAYDLKNNPNYTSLILADSSLKARIILDVPNKFFNMSENQINGYIRNVARQNGALNAFIATQNVETYNKLNTLNTLRDCILYSISENGDLIAKNSKTKNDPSHTIFEKYNANAVSANEKIEDIYNSIFNDNTAPKANEIEVAPKVKKGLNPIEISKLIPEDASTTPKLKEKHYKEGNKQSSFFRNVVEDSRFLNEDVRQMMSKEDNIRYYKGITNQDTLEKAYKSLQDDGAKATNEWFIKDDKNSSAEDIAKGWILLRQYQEIGDHEGTVEVAKKMRSMLTNAGQTVQMANLLSRLTPEGMFYYAQSELSEAYNKMVEGKSKKWIEANQDKFNLTPKETQFIMDTMQDVSKMEDGRDKTVKLAEIQKMMQDKLPPTEGQSIKAWMRISMLLNPKTLHRNILGNEVVLPVNITSDAFSSLIDRQIAKKTGVRTTGNINLKNYAKGFKQGLFESYDDFRRGINTRDIQGNKFEIGEGKSFKNKGIGKVLNRLDNILNFALDAGDRPFYEATFTNSINNQLVLNKTTEVTQDMIDIATNEALQRTWQDNNNYTKAVLSIRKILNYANVKGYGLGDIVIPFAKTPANLTKAIVDYSPAGLAKTLAVDARKFKNSLSNGQYTPQLQHQFVQNLGKGMAGSLLYVLAYGLAKAGIATGESDDDKDVKNFMKNSLGISSYSIKIGDKTFTYDWAQPIATPLAIMTNYVKYSKDNPDSNAIEKAIKAMDIGSEQLLEQSFMESLNTVLNGNGTTLENLSKAVLDLPARAIPTFSKQIADMVDSKQRTSFEYGKPFESAINAVKAKIPGASMTLPTARDTLGNDIEKYGGDNNLWNVMFNPANMNKGKLSKAGKEIYDVYMQTGDSTIMPRVAPYYINSNGEKINMSAYQRSEFQKLSGQYVEKTLDSLLNNNDYKKLSNEQKAEVINNIVSDSYLKAKYDILKIDNDSYAKTRETLKNISTSTYYSYKIQTEGMNKDIDKLNVLNNSSYTNKEKQTIYENFIKSSNDNKYNVVKSVAGSKFNINSYLKYKIAVAEGELKADKEDNGTEKGKTISGSAKTKTFNYINSLENTTYMQKVVMYGLVYTPSQSDKQTIVNYIKSLPGKTAKEKIDMLHEFSWITFYNNGSFKY